MAKGLYTFTTEHARQNLNRSAVAIKATLRRLRKAGSIATIHDLHLIIPPQYRALGCLPPDQFIDVLMQHLNQKYYVALLSAAELHGAAHQRPQKFFVAVEKIIRPVKCGRVHILFVKHSFIDSVAIEQKQNARGYFFVSSPEATAIDLVAFTKRNAGLNNVATVLAELSEKIQPEKLLQQLDAWAEPPWAQRLGFLLEMIGANDSANAVATWVDQNKPRCALLEPRTPRGQATINKRWRLWINVNVEVDE